MRYINQDNIVTLDESKIPSVVRTGISTVIGSRQYQQDAVFYFNKDSCHIAAVCDGMGGLNGGEIASRAAVEMLKQDFKALNLTDDIIDFLHNEAVKLDRVVAHLKDKDGKPLEAGTTIVSSILLGDELYWMSVGDSKIYIIRGGRIYAVTEEHNYFLTLNILRKRGMISDENYEAESAKGEALISYLGMGNLSLIDSNDSPMYLERGDIILLCSDGLYKSVDESRILNIIQQYSNMQDAASALTSYAVNLNKPGQDNISVILLQYL